MRAHLPRGRGVRALAAVLLAFLAAGCSLRLDRIDVSAVEGARLALRAQSEGDVRKDRYRFEDEEESKEEDPPGSVGSMILGELIAIFPGVLVPGVGHLYAGDRASAERLFHITEFGYILTALGGGLLIGGYLLHENDIPGTAYGLIASGALVGGIGLGYWFTAWFFDMIDTPRAVRENGKPPERTPFIDALDFFE